MRVGFTYDAESDYAYKKKVLPDEYAEFDVEITLSQIESAIKSGGHEIIRIGNAKNLLRRLHEGERWDIVFNICEGLKGRNRESYVPAILELFDIPYTGSDALTMALTLDKIMAKKVVEYHGLRTAKFISVNPAPLPRHNSYVASATSVEINEDRASNSCNKLYEVNILSELDKSGLSFPVIVKPSQEGTSKGISEDSIVHNSTQLEQQVTKMLQTYHQPILIEEFIKGYEFTVAIVGNNPPEVLPPVQVSICGKLDLGEQFYTYARVESSEIEYICPAKISPQLNTQICQFASKVYEVLDIKDVGRVDIRVDYNNRIYFLECNPLPNLGRSDVFPLVAKASGRTYEQLICEILNSALKRYHLL